MALRRALPGILLLAYGVAFGVAAFGASTPAFDDHPGQVYRLWHALTHGLRPATWNPGWWAGYPELQFYPPGLFYLGALLHAVSLGTLSVEATYQALLWIAWLLPGMTVYLVLTRLLGSGWLALPGAFIALTVSAVVQSGAEGGVHIGMAPARLAWGLLPLLLFAVLRWLASSPRPEWPVVVAAPLVAAIVVTHPAHAPAAIVVALLAVWVAAPSERWARLEGVGLALIGAAMMTAFWTVPLVVRLEHARALAWGHLEPPTQLLLVILLVLAALARRLRRSRHAVVAGNLWAMTSVVVAWPWAMAAVVAVDAVVLEPFGIHWLPSDRVSDGAWMAVVIAAGFTTGRLLERLATRRKLPVAGLALAAVAATIVLSVPGRALALWPRPADWPTYEATARGLRLGDLWAALRRAPAGRVLFVRSSVPLVFGSEWWRPHTHVTALTPIHAGREIVNGTFTHPSPVAALVYRGSTAPGPITTLVERLDGRSLFGRPLDALDATALDQRVDRLGVSVIVALDEDVPRLAALNDNPGFLRKPAIGPFVLYERRAVAAVPHRVDDLRWRLSVDAPPGTWVTTRTSYYPLWRAERDGRPLETRPGPAWDLEVRLDERAGPIDLVYTAGRLETAMAALSAGALLMWIGWCWRAWRAPSP